MNDNPFAPTGGSIVEPPPPREDVLEPVPLDPGEVLGRCWHLFSHNIGLVLGALILPAVVSFGLSLLSGAMNAANELGDWPMNTFFSLASFSVDPVLKNLVGLFFSLGAIRIYMNLSRGQNADLSMLVGESRRYLSGLFAAILMGSVWLVAFSPLLFGGVVLAEARQFESLGILAVSNFAVMFVPMLVVSTGTQFMLYVVVDRGAGPWAAIKGSWQLTDGYKMSIFFVNALIGLFALVISCVSFGIGLLLLVPTMVLAQGVMYHSLTHLRAIKTDGIW